MPPGSCRDGTTSMVLFIGDLMKQAERQLGEGVHPRIITEVTAHAAKSKYSIDTQQHRSLLWGTSLVWGAAPACQTHLANE